MASTTLKLNKPPKSEVDLAGNSAPKKNKIDIWPLVLKDLKERVKLGKSRYGTVLQTNNGRDALLDAYEEAMDLAIYLRQVIEERKEGQIDRSKLIMRGTIGRKEPECEHRGASSWTSGKANTNTVKLN